jgi:hypothetical protein
MNTKSEIGTYDRVGELDDKIRDIMKQERNPMMSTMDIAERVYGSMMLTTQTAQYRRVLRSMQRLMKLGEVWCYNQGQRSAVIYVLKVRVKK